PAGAVSPVSRARALPCRGGGAARAHSGGGHAPPDQRLPPPPPGFFLCFPPRPPPRGVPREPPSPSPGETRAGERSVPQLGGVPHDRWCPRSERLADLGAARWRKLAPLLLSLDSRA